MKILKSFVTSKESFVEGVTQKNLQVNFIISILNFISTISRRAVKKIRDERKKCNKFLRLLPGFFI